MASWGTRRRNQILFVVFLLIAIPISLFVFFVVYEAPTCFDLKQNGEELGIDCGGACQLVCNSTVIDPLVRWHRHFEVVPGLYNAVAYVENQNTDAGTKSLEYKFTLYDSENAILADKVGSIELRPKEIIPIIEDGLNTGMVTPVRMTFEITNEIVWEVQEPRNPVIVVQDERLMMVDGSPRINAVLYNRGQEDVSDFDVAVILYNTEDNAIGVSSTYAENVKAGGVLGISFTWPMTFNGEVASFEIIPLYAAD